jgi:hypothetical protein
MRTEKSLNNLPQVRKQDFGIPLLNGLNSGETTPMVAQDWEDIRQAVNVMIKKTNS